MNTKLIFRILLIAPIVLMIIYSLLPTVEYLWLSCDELNLLEADGFNTYIPKNYIIFLVYIILWLAISTGLFFLAKFTRIFRIAYVVFVCLSALIIFFLGNRISAPLESFILYLIVMSVGAVCTLLFSPSMSEYFSKGAQQESKDNEDEDER